MGSYLDKPVTEKESHESEAHGLKFGAAAMQGWRVEMEDAHTVAEYLDPDLEGHSFIAVYDGHGGQYTAHYCGQHMLRFLKATPGFAEYKRTRDVMHLEHAIHTAYLEVDRVLKQEEEVVSKQDSSGCTAICAIITPTHIVVGNSGDSRAVVYTSTEAIPLSRDHKPFLDDERKRIEDAGGIVTMQRVDGDLALSRSIGDFQYKDRNLPPEKQKVTAVPEIKMHVRTSEDEVLVLACDGLWDVCENEDAGKIVRSILNDGEEHLKLICEELLDQCLLRYSKDNISAVLVAFHPLFENHLKKGDGVVGRRRRRDDPDGQVKQEDGGPENHNNDDAPPVKREAV